MFLKDRYRYASRQYFLQKTGYSHFNSIQHTPPDTIPSLSEDKVGEEQVLQIKSFVYITKSIPLTQITNL